MQKKKLIAVGDIHGKREIVSTVLKNFPDHTIVFVGDFLDSYDRSVQDQIKALIIALEAAENNSNVHLLYGNHELSYLDIRHRASGFNAATSAHVKVLQPRIENVFKNHFVWNGILFTHAGASFSMFEDIEEVKHKSSTNHYSIHMVGHSRGGIAPCGGLFWCDFWGELSPIPNLTQVCGHSAWRPTGTRGIVTMLVPKTAGQVINIDCLHQCNEVLEIIKNEKGQLIFNAIDFETGETIEELK